ncbi:MAG: hypothetical protein JWP87_3981 [Labilithrix sp.]|nr:hypothetical protein [Labilithrix sp.]
MQSSRGVGWRIALASAAALLGASSSGACRCGAVGNGAKLPLDAARDADAEAASPGASDAAADRSDDAEQEPADEPPPGALETVQRLLFSARGRLAFVEGTDAFAVIDTRSGAVRRYRGSLDPAHTLGFDNRCDVSLRGYMPNVDIYSMATDPEENVFVRSTGSSSGRSFREDASRGTTLAVGTRAEVHASVVTFETADGKLAAVTHGSARVGRVADEPRDVHVVDSSDAKPRTASIRYRESAAPDGSKSAELQLDDLASGTSLRFPTEPGSLDPFATWVSFERGLLVTVVMVVREAGKRTEVLCARDLGAGATKPACVSFSMPAPFFRMLVSDDGTRIAFTERIPGPADPRKPVDEYARDASRDACNLHVLDRRTGKDVRWRSRCSTTTEVPLRFEGDLLVTDAADIVKCHRSIFRRYDAATGALRSSAPGPSPREDVDDKLLAAVAKRSKGGPMPFVLKQELWAGTYGHDELVAWSEGTEVLARRGTDLVLCHKRGGTCGPSLATIAEGAIGGATPDGAMLGAVSGGHFFAVDAKTGAKMLDVAIEPPAR